jgi:hypothetical protein
MRAAVFKRRDKFIIHPVSKSVRGLGVDSPPYEVLPGDISAAELGGAVLRALQASRLGVPRHDHARW